MCHGPAQNTDGHNTFIKAMKYYQDGAGQQMSGDQWLLRGTYRQPL